MAQKRLYPKCAGEIDGLAEHLKEKYPDSAWETQFLKFDDEKGKGTVFQVRPKPGAWQTVKNWTGLGMAATASMKAVGEALEVEVGGGKWLDKAAIIGAVPLMFAPLVVAAGVGAWLQNRLLAQVLAEIEAYFRNEATALKCVECGADYAAGARFCSACGKAVGQQAQV